MKTLLIVALALVCTLPGQRFRTGVDAVRVDVLVTQGRRPVTGLTAADFEVKDRGVLQAVEAVTVADIPIDMIVSLDTSASVAGEMLEQLKSGVSSALTTLGPKDRAALLTFSSEVRLVQDWSGDVKTLDGSVKALTAGGGTSLWDSVFTALTLLEPNPDVRRLCMVFSDGDDTSSWLPRAAVLEKARRSDAVIYSVETRNEAPGARRVLNYRSGITLSKSGGETGNEAPFLEDLADSTGGAVLNANRSGQLRNVFKEIVTEFRTRYVLTYQPKGVEGPGWHPIEVKLRGKSGSVRARRGYNR